jgi:hypothetical protein
MELNFKLWVEGHRATRGKVSLYPPFYTQYMNYPPQDVVTWSADAITYMDDEDVKFKAYDGKFRPYFWHGIYAGRTATGSD